MRVYLNCKCGIWSMPTEKAVSETKLKSVDELIIILEKFKQDRKIDYQIREYEIWFWMINRGKRIVSEEDKSEKGSNWTKAAQRDIYDLKLNPECPPQFVEACIARYPIFGGYVPPKTQSDNRGAVQDRLRGFGKGGK